VKTLLQDGTKHAAFGDRIMAILERSVIDFPIR